ncbi:MAG: peptide ABC transporter permease [Acidobacteria bacterium]|nr:MAG: peptide ABC transporter permease [Acidobacteriota bacterium]
MPRKSSLYRDTWRRFARDRLAIGGLIILLTLGLAAGSAPLLARFAPNQVDLRKLDAAPSRAHWFGTDDLGRDEFSRALYAGRVSLSIGVLSAAVAAVAGTTVGSSAGYYGGGVDSVLMRATDVVLSIPPLPLVIVLSAIAKPSPLILILIIAGIGWMGTARLVRSAFLTIREGEYVEAARAMGCSNLRIILRHALPNSLGPVIVAATLAVGNAIITESVLSFLGVGVQPPTASWGNMLQHAESTMATNPWLSIFPGLFILLSALSVNALGDGLRDALDVRMKE